MSNNTAPTQQFKTPADALAHFGVKGMKWGVRKSEGGSGGEGGGERGKFKRAATKANTALKAGAKVIEDGEKKLIFLPQEKRNKAASATQAQVLGEAVRINKSPKFKGKDLKKDPALKAEYFKQVEAAAKKIYADELNIARTEAWADFLGTKVDTNSMRIYAASNRIQHAVDGEETLLVLKWDLDSLGQITNVTVPPAYLKHDEDIDLELAHYGVKGMKWGVRRAEKARSTAERNQRIADGTASRKDKIDQAVLGKGMGGFGGALSLHPKVAGWLAKRYDKKATRLEGKVAAKERAAEAISAHKKWKEDVKGPEMAEKVFQKATDDFQKTAEIINNDPNYKGKDVSSPPLSKHYEATMNHYFNEHLAQASIDLTLNDQGQAFVYKYDSSTGLMRGSEYKLKSVEIEHSDAAKFDMPDYKVEVDDLGHMQSFSVVGSLYHSQSSGTPAMLRGAHVALSLIHSDHGSVVVR